MRQRCFPNEEIIVQCLPATHQMAQAEMAPRKIVKLANALLPDAAPSLVLGPVVTTATRRFVEKKGGLWVGGKVTATPEWLTFEPNRLNEVIHVRLETFRLSRSDMKSVRREFGWLTGIVIVEHVDGVFRFRCFGAAKVANTMNSWLSRTRSDSK